MAGAVEVQNFEQMKVAYAEARNVPACVPRTLQRIVGQVWLCKMMRLRDTGPRFVRHAEFGVYKQRIALMAGSAG